MKHSINTAPTLRTLPVHLGSFEGVLFGGPYRNKPVKFRGVKLAQEINLPFDVELKIVDFGVPTQEGMTDAIKKTLDLLARGEQVYAGCMGGIGRTGTFLACFQKVQYEYARHFADTELYQHADPVREVRRAYLSHAVETMGQERFIDSFDPTEALEHWLSLESSQFTPGLGFHFDKLRYRLRKLWAALTAPNKAASPRKGI